MGHEQHRQLAAVRQFASSLLIVRGFHPIKQWEVNASGRTITQLGRGSALKKPLKTVEHATLCVSVR